MTDWSGLKYIVVESAGESIDIVFARFRPESFGSNQPSIEYFSRKHTTFDGVGAFADILKTQGYAVDKLPQASNSAADPKGFEKIALVHGFGKNAGAAQSGWKREVDFTKSGLGPGYALAYFPEDQTKQILKKKKFTMSAFFIQTLDRVAHAHFLASGHERKWVLPMNMRGGPIKETYFGNCAASIILRVNSNSTESQIQDSIAKYVANRLHWGGWYYTNLPKYIGLKLFRLVAGKLKNGAFGILTNLGTWPPKTIRKSADDTEDVWTTISPPSKVVPVSSSCLIWKGQLSLTLRLHPSLGKDLKFTETILREWVREIALACEIPTESIKIRSFEK